MVNLGQLEKIWTPDTFIYNLLNKQQLRFTKHNSFMRLYKNGTVYLWSKHLLVISCYMDFTDYPMDRQECSLKMGSSTYDERYQKYVAHRKIRARSSVKGRCPIQNWYFFFPRMTSERRRTSTRLSSRIWTLTREAQCPRTISSATPSQASRWCCGGQ